MSKSKAATATSAFSGASQTLYVGGQLYTLNEKTNQLEAGPVGYLDQIETTETPMIPDIKFQNEFANRVSRAIADHNKTAKTPVVRDTVRMSGFDGIGIVDANATYFVVREDHASAENYSHDHALQFRANDYVTFYVNGGAAGGAIYNQVIADLQLLDAKK